ncbi:MAG TPA: SDR family NAD(P)-dependent oxidoreductase [Pseudonocardia sp.]|nr:SDR family NAD(P)-dependent oxidoreductase [Pseudonocardia sp.]
MDDLWRFVLLVAGLADSDVDARLYCLTRAGVSAGSEDSRSPSATALWGLARVAALENAVPWGGVLDLPRPDEGVSWPSIVGVLANGMAGETELAVRPDGVLARRVLRAPSGSTGELPDVTGGTVLVTGGTGGLGVRVARWLISLGPARIVLVSRSGRSVVELDEESAEAGVVVETVPCDVTDGNAVRELVERIQATGAPLRGVVHAAGTVDSAGVTATDREAFESVARAKIDGARHLHEATLGLDLALFVTFSSISGVWGSAGQGAYAAGNAYLDGLVAQRRGRGLVGTSVSWGAWAGGGMVDDEGARYLAQRGGLTRMAPELAIAALARAVANDEAHSIVADVDLARLAALFDTVGLARLFAELPEARVDAANEVSAAAVAGGLAERLVGLPMAQRRRAVGALVREQVAAVLGFPSVDSVDVDRPFRELGFDSLTAVEFRNALSAAAGVAVSGTVVFDHPSPSATAEHLLGLLGLAEQTAGVATVSVAADPDEPIAIVGMACRLPGGVNSPEDLWELVRAGDTGIAPFPTDRGWDPSLSGLGGFVYDVADFDAAFFRISPREAFSMDPQQRQVLECSWEALERAGIDPHSLRGTDSGVFLGVNPQDYAVAMHGRGAASEGSDASDSDGYLLTGSSQSVVSGRVSYVLGLEGPAVSVDTACSSSLVALHLAAQALRRGECSMALAGGVTVMATPGAFIEFAKQGGLASDGLCKSFADAADGTGWSEGVGMLVVERLSDARRHGHQVLAVLTGSAINQDGASNGLTAPNGPSQQRVITRALAEAGLTPADVDVVEAHGTGTKLGDPIEAQALLATYGQNRDVPLYLGSLKSNIGHTQAASGVVGVIKTVESVRRGVLPRSLHIDAPSSHVDWTAGAVELLTEARDWPETGRPRRAGVSAFGVSGTNAHVIIEQAPEEPAEADSAPDRPADVLVPWVVSARSAGALEAQLPLLADLDSDPVDVGWSLATTRAALPERAVLLGGLSPVARGEAGGEGRVGVVFSGQGAQRAGMGRELAARFPVFARAFDEVLDQFAPEVREALGDERVNRTEFTQPGLFAFEVALYRLVESWGVRPEVLVGHSIGELTAAYVAGVWSLADACALVAARGRLMGALPAGGAMVALRGSEDAVRAVLTDGVSIAAVNGPDTVVISGAEAEVVAIAEGWEGKTTRLRVSHAFHSVLMEPMLAEFRSIARGLSYAEPTVPVISNLSGEVGEQLTDPEYWVRHVRAAVRFADGVSALWQRGVDAVVEVGPRAALSSAITEIAGDRKVAVAPLGRDDDEVRAALTGAARLWVSGVNLNWAEMFAGLQPRRVDLPTYAFQRQRFWFDTRPTPAPSRRDSVDERFWDAVRRLDVDHLAAELGLADPDQLDTVMSALSSWRHRADHHDDGDDLRYAVEWAATELPRAMTIAGRWLVVSDASADRDPLVDGLAEALRQRGGEVVEFPLDPATDDRASLAGRLGALDRTASFDGVVSLLAPDRGPWIAVAAPGTRLVVSTLNLFQALGDAGIAGRFWAVTRGSVAIVPGTDRTDPGQAPLWGFGRSAALEETARWGGLVDVPTDIAAPQLARLCDVLAAPHNENQLALRAHTVFGSRLTRRAARPDPGEWRPRGTVLVTGGTGGIGTELTAWLARSGAEHVVLVSRRGAVGPWLDEIRREYGLKVTVARCDVADREALAAVLAAVPDEYPLTTVIHAAAVLDDGVVDAMTPAALERVLAAKSVGAWNLHTLTEGLDLDRFVMFSSVSGVWGNSGQANYAAANAYLDALAQYRRDRGLAATSIAWGPWAEGGMASTDVVSRRMERAGLTPLVPARGFEALRRVLEAEETAVAVVDIDWQRFMPHLSAAGASPLLARLRPDANGSAPAGAQAVASVVPLPVALAQARPQDREFVLFDAVCGAVATVLGHSSSDAVGPHQQFKDLGFDSLTAVELRNLLTARTGLGLSATLVFDHPTPARLAEELGEQLLPRDQFANGGPADTEPANGAPESDRFAEMSADDLIRAALGEEDQA